MWVEPYLLQPSLAVIAIAVAITAISNLLSKHLGWPI
jgi:hypothetical protein